jgi:N-acetylmuramate 1-kinase
MPLDRTKLNSWLFGILNTNEFILNELAGDASPRRYLRLKVSNSSFIVMVAAADASLRAFINISKFLVANNITAPKVYHLDIENGFLLLQDFGDDLLLKTLNNSANKHLALQKYYTQAIDSLILMQRMSPKAGEVIVSNFDEHYLLDRLNVLFKDWYLSKYLQIKPRDDQLDLVLHNLIQRLLVLNKELPQVFVHLDYHSRNIVILKNGDLGILDFQDAKFGPATYDLLSLLQDAYIVCPENLAGDLIKYYIEQAKIAGILPGDVVEDKIYTSFYLFGLHRHLKNLGVFARLFMREKNDSYLPHIPTLINYILDICNKFPELTSLKQFFQEITLIEYSN